MTRALVAAGLVLAATLSNGAGAHESDSKATPPGFTRSRTGSVHDFDFFAGGWTTVQHRLKARGAGSTDWEAFPATLCMTPYLDGMATVDEMHMPTRGAHGTSGLTLRTFNPATRQWSIYWVSSATGQLDPTPLVGGFDGSRGEFYADDEEDGRPTQVRYLWIKLDADHARWEQAISRDDQHWETNWTADFTRADTDATCDHGRPRRPGSAP